MDGEKQQTPDETSPPPAPAQPAPQLATDMNNLLTQSQDVVPPPTPQAPAAAPVPAQTTPSSYGTYPPASAPPTQPLPIVQPEKHGSKKLYVALSILGAVLVLASGAFAVYFFGIRVPDSDYASTTTSVQAMATDAKKLEANTKVISPALQSIDNVGTTASDTASIKQAVRAAVPEAKQKVTECKQSLIGLETSSVVKRDGEVKSAYTKAHDALKACCQESDDIVKTAEIVLGIADESEALQNVSSIKTLAAYDAATKSMQLYIDKYPTVPLKKYNDTVYEPVVKAVTKLITAGHDVIAAVEVRSVTQYRTAYQDYIDAIEQAQDVQKKASTYTSDVPQPPVQELNALESAIKDRKEQFFRF